MPCGFIAPKMSCENHFGGYCLSLVYLVSFSLLHSRAPCCSCIEPSFLTRFHLFRLNGEHDNNHNKNVQKPPHNKTALLGIEFRTNEWIMILSSHRPFAKFQAYAFIWKWRIHTFAHSHTWHQKTDQDFYKSISSHTETHTHTVYRAHVTLETITLVFSAFPLLLPS